MIKRLAIMFLLLASMSGYGLYSLTLHNTAEPSVTDISETGVDLSEESAVREDVVSLHFSDALSQKQSTALLDISSGGEYDVGLDDALRQALEQTNAYRRNAGVSELLWSNELADGASVRAEELKIQFSHTRPDGSVPTTICPMAHGENLSRSNVACRIDDVPVIDALYASESHRRAMLNPIYEYIGMAYSYDESGCKCQALFSLVR